MAEEEIKDPFDGLVDPFAAAPAAAPAAPEPRTRLEHLGEAVQPWKHVAKEFSEGVEKVNPFDADYQKERDAYLKEVADTPWYDLRPELKRTARAGAGLAQAALSPLTGAMKSVRHLGEAVIPSETPEEIAERKKKGLPIPKSGGDLVEEMLSVIAPTRWGPSYRAVGKPPSAIAPEAPTPPATGVQRPSDVVLSKGQETGELPLIQREQGALQGTSGAPAQQRALEFFEGQQKPQIEAANEAVRESLRPAPSMNAGVASPREAAESIVDQLIRTHDARTQWLNNVGTAADQVRETLRGRLSPNGSIFARTPDEAANMVSSAVAASDDAARAATNAAYRQFEELPGQFHPATFNTSATELRNRVASPENIERMININPDNTPTTMRAFEELPEILKGLTQRRDPETRRVIGGELPLTPRRVELVRQRLNTYLGDALSAGNPRDTQAMRRLIDEWDGLIQRKLRTTFTGGDPEAVIQGIGDARRLHREHRQAFYPRGNGDKVGPVIQNIIGRHEGQALTPEQLSKTLYESANAVPVARHLNEIFADAPQIRTALSQGFFSHVLDAPPGKAAYTPAQIADRIDRFTRGSGQSLSESYLNRNQIEQLQRYGQLQRQYGQQLNAPVDPVERALRRMTGADGNARASIDDTMGAVFGSILRSNEYAPELVRRLTTGQGALGAAEQGFLREGALRYAMQAPKGEEALGYKRIADNLHQLVTNEAGRTLYSPEQRAMIGELRDLYKKLIVPRDGKGWSNTASMIAPVIEAVGGRATQAIATGVAHVAGAGLGTSEALGLGVSKLAQRVTHRKAAKEVAEQLPLIGEQLTKYQKALTAHNKRNNALTRSQLRGAATSLNAATSRIGVDLTKLPALQLPGPVGAEDDNTPGRAEGGGVVDPFDAPADASNAGSLWDQLGSGASAAYDFTKRALPMHMRAPLEMAQGVVSPEGRKAFMEGVSKSGGAGLKSYGEAVENQYVPEGAVGHTDAGEWLDKDGNILPNQYRPNILPATKAAKEGEGWFGSNWEGAMPAMLDVWNTTGSPTRMASAAVAAAKSGAEGKVATQAAHALREGQDVYHGTRKPTFDKFYRDAPEAFTIDRILGTHVAPDPEIANTFTQVRDPNNWGKAYEGGLYPLRMPKEAKFLDVPNPGDRFDQTAVEHLVMRHVYERAPDMLERYLRDALRFSTKEAREGADALTSGGTVDIHGKDYNLKRLIENWGGTPYNTEDRRAAAELFKQDMQEQGYAGLRYRNTSPEEIRNAKDKSSYIVFDPGQTLQNRLTGAFMSDSGTEGRVASQAAQALRPENAAFYSAAERAVEGAKQAKATPDQWVNWLRNQPGVTKDEIEHLGLDDWAKSQKGTVSKEDFLQELRGKGLGLKEEVRGRGLNEDSVAETVNRVFNERLNQDLRNHIESGGAASDFPYPSEEVIRTVMRHIDQEVRSKPWYFDLDSSPTRYHDYTLPGGENYREVISRIPTAEERIPWDRAHFERFTELEKKLASNEPYTQAEVAEYQRLGRAAQARDSAPDPYTHSHWPGVENPLYHMRVNDRKIPGVGDSYHLEELQSDWHQQGRKKGYADVSIDREALTQERDNAAARLRNYYQNLPERHRPTAAEINREFERIRNGREPLFVRPDAPEFKELWQGYRDAQLREVASREAVPDAPFKKNWAELGLRNALIKAVQEGKDAISWTPGAEQAKRYSLSKQIDSLRYDPENQYLVGYKNSREHFFGKQPPEKLPDLVGKEVAERLLKAKKDKQGVHRLDGVDLDVGGEGMKAFYDKMLVNKANDIGKKFGAKVEWKDLRTVDNSELEDPVFENGHWWVYPGPDRSPLGPFSSEAAASKASKEGVGASNIQVPVLKITPELRQHIIQKGLPLFAESGGEGKVASQAAQASRESPKNWIANASAPEIEKLKQNAVFYHGTTQEVADRIMKEGLSTKHSGSGADAWLSIHNPDAVLTERPASVFMAKDVQTAQFYAKTVAELYPGAEPVIFKLRIPKSYEGKLVKDEEHLGSAAYRYPGRVPPQWIRGYEVLGDKPIKDDSPLYSVAFAQSGGEGKTVSQTGDAIVDLGKHRERKQVESWAKDFGEGVRKRAREVAELAQQYHDDGRLPFPVGTRFSTEHSRNTGRAPWEVTGYAIDSKNPDKYGYYVERGKKGDDDWERSSILVNDPNNPRIKELAEQIKPFGGPKSIFGDSGGEGKLASHAADYYRKIDALEAMANDRAASPNEKQTALTLKARLEKRLQEEFPNARRPKPKTDSPTPGWGSATEMMSDPWVKWALGLGDYLKKEELWKSDRKAAEAELLRRIQQRKAAVARHVQGDLESLQNVKDARYSVDRFMREFLPDVWEAEQAKREVAGNKASQRADIKRRAKQAEIKKANEGRLSYGASKLAAAPFATKLKDVIQGVHAAGSYKGLQYNREGNFLTWLSNVHAPVVRHIVKNLDPAEKSKLIDLVERSAEQGQNKVFTRKQKDDFIKKLNSAPVKTQYMDDEAHYFASKKKPQRRGWAMGGAVTSYEQQQEVPGPVSEEDDGNAPAAKQRAAGGRVVASNINHSPSEAQKSAGNYAKDKVHLYGLLITIENAKGKPRKGIGKDGTPWSVIMPQSYGYINGSVGADKDHVDVYVGPHTKSPHVFVIDQCDADSKEFDEHKTFCGFANERQVIQTYLKGFSDGKGSDRISAIKRMTVPEFKQWVFSPKAKKPVAP